ncbi:MAG: TolC family protein [Alistipes sp.]|jgi:outer membrane protein|nr:TolC family protein [Alistipes sp.]
MKRIILIAAALVLCSAASGQQKKWTLRECIDYAVENNIEIRQTALGVENAGIELNTALNSRLPNLNAGMGQSFSFGRTSVDAGGDTPEYRNTQTSGSSMSISAGMPLFQGFGITNRIAAGRVELAAAAEGLERAKQNLELNVAALYLDVLFKQEILAVYREQTALMRRQVENTSRMVDEGKVARAQLLDIASQLASNEMNEVGAANDLTLSLLTLAQALNLDDTSGFDIAGVEAASLTPSSLAALPSPDDIYRVAVDTRPVVREAQLRLQSSELSVKIAKAAFMPSLNLSAQAGASYMYMFGQDFQQASLADQIRNRHSESVGLNLSIPIFSRNATRNNVRSARIGVQNQTLALEGVKQALYKEIQQAWQRALAAGARYDAATKALAAAEEAARTMRLRYDEGKATAYEYSEAQTRLTSSRSDQTQARYDYLLSTKILDFYTGRAIEI